MTTTPPPSLHEAIARAGSPMQLLWKPSAPPWTVPIVEPEYAGWGVEQEAWRTTVALHRIERNGRLVGMTFWTANIAPVKRMLSLALVDHVAAAPGTEVEVVWGEHPGHGTAPDADLGFARIRATVQLSPYSEYARTAYRVGSL